MSQFTITRRIEIDAGHRIPDHESKCRGLHGHRYVIEADVRAELVETGAEKGMVMDFAFLKEAMVAEIYDPCDHGLILSVHDPLVPRLFKMHGLSVDVGSLSLADLLEDANKPTVRANQWSFLVQPQLKFVKLYLIQNPPTAEILASHWFERLRRMVAEHTEGRVALVQVRVWETPNCVARFPS